MGEWCQGLGVLLRHLRTSASSVEPQTFAYESSWDCFILFSHISSGKDSLWWVCIGDFITTHPLSGLFKKQKKGQIALAPKPFIL